MTAAAIREHFRHRTRSKQPFALAWNASVLSHDIETGTTRTAFHGKWIHLPTAHRGVVRWSPIVAEFIGDGGAFSLADSPLQLSAPQQATGQFEVTNSLCWDIFEKQKIGAKSASMSITHAGARPVDGVILDGRPWQVVYPDALGDGVDIVYGLWHARSPRAEVVYVIRREPAGDGEVVAIEKNVRLQSGLAFNNHQPNERFTLHGQSGGISLAADPKRGFGIRPAKAWYYDAAGEQHTFDISLVIEPGPRGSVTVRKIVPRALIREALSARPGGELRVDTTSTFYPNANTETTSVDGVVERTPTTETWSTIRGGAGTSSDDSIASTFLTRIKNSSTSNQYDNLRQAVFLFDTSAIGGLQNADGGTLSIWGTTNASALGGSVTPVSSSPASNTSLSSSDYGSLGTVALSNTSVNCGSWTNGAYNDFVLNAAGVAEIAVTGITKLGLRISYDRTNSEPTWVGSSSQSRVNGYFADQTGTTNDPLLTVEHSAAENGKPVFSNTYRRLRT